MDRAAIPWDELSNYVQNAALTLGLTDWQIVVSDEQPAGDSHAAEVTIPKGRKYATMVFADSFFWAQGAEERRETVYHELMHCVFARAWETISTVREFLSPDAWNMWFENARLAEEQFVDATAAAIAPRLAPPLKLSKVRRAAKVYPAGRSVSAPTRNQGAEPETPGG